MRNSAGGAADKEIVFDKNQILIYLCLIFSEIEQRQNTERKP